MSESKAIDNFHKAIKEGSPEEKVRAWLQLTRDESGHSKQGVIVSIYNYASTF
jgi:hypothetical protein